MEASTFVKPDLPGSHLELVGAQTVRPTPSIAQTVAIPLVTDWGPLGSEEGPQRFSSFEEFEDMYGDTDNDARDAVLGAFLGPGIPGDPGAGGVIVYRMALTSGGTAAAKATLTINNTNAAPAPAIRIDARYKGDRGERISIVVENDPGDPTNNDRLRILFDGDTVEKYVYPEANIEALVDAINNRPSRYVTAALLADDDALAATAATALAGGADGSAVTATQYTEALDALEYEPFSILAPANLTDAAIGASLAAWTATAEEQQRPVVLVLGGPAVETLDAAITRASGLRAAAPDGAHHVVCLAGGQFADAFTGKNLSTAKLASRIGGMLAGRGEQASITLGEIAGLSIVGQPTVVSDQLAEARDAGLTVFRRTESEDADLAISQGVTLYIGDTTAKPYQLFSDPRIVRVIDMFRRRMRQWGNKNIAGKTTVVENTRVAVRDRGRAEIRELLTRGLIVPGDTPEEAPFFRVLDNGGGVNDAIAYEFGWQFAYTTNYLLGRGRVR